MTRYFTNKVRGLATALSLALMLTVSMNVGYCETSNELREVLGMPKNTYGISNVDKDGIKDSIGNNTSDKHSDTITDEDKQSEQIVHGSINLKDVSGLEDEMEQLKTRLESRITNQASAYILSITVDSIVDLQNQIYRVLNSSEYSTDYITTVDKNIEKPNYDEEAIAEEIDTNNLLVEQNVSSEILDTINSLEYDIGDIGSRALCVVENRFKIVTPYGFTKHASQEQYTNSKLLGIELAATVDEGIRSQWNGIVVGLYKDPTSNAQTVKVYHGNSTYTVYSHVNPVAGIHIGKEVQTGEIIARATDTTSIEKDKTNHIFYQIKLNGEFINPLLIYGTRGKTLYENWLTTTSYDNAVEVGEKYYCEMDESYRGEYDTSDDPAAVIFPDFNIEPVVPSGSDWDENTDWIYSEGD